MNRKPVITLFVNFHLFFGIFLHYIFSLHISLSPYQIGLRSGTDPGHLVLAKALLTPIALNPLQHQLHISKKKSTVILLKKGVIFE